MAEDGWIGRTRAKLIEEVGGTRRRLRKRGGSTQTDADPRWPRIAADEGTNVYCAASTPYGGRQGSHHFRAGDDIPDRGEHIDERMAQKGRDKERNRAARASEREVEFISVKSPRTSHASRPLSEPKPIWAYCAFAAVALIFFFAHLTGSAFFWEDFTEQFFPFQSFAARSFADGTIPFWNPYTFAGMPFFADLQNGMYYPGHLLLY